MITASTENRLLRIGKLSALLLFLLGNSLVRLIFPLVAEAFVKHQRQDVVLVVLPGSLAAEYICRALQVVAG